jgi:hypothetical protein
MDFEKVTIDQAVQEYEAQMDAMGLSESQRTFFAGMMRTHLENCERSIESLENLVLEQPVAATGEYLDQRLLGCEWLGPTNGTETIAPQDEPKPNHVRDAVRANQQEGRWNHLT